MAKFMGIDYGLERTGLAISDPDGKLAFPLTTLSLSAYGARKNLLSALVEQALHNKAEALVIGLPLGLDGAENLTCSQVRNIVRRIKNRIDLPVYFMPETLSSEEARLDLLAAGVKRKKAREVLDQQAACRILASFLAQPEHLRISA